MSAAPKVEPAVDEVLPWEDIKLRHPDQWVCVVDLVRDNLHYMGFSAARVVATAPTRSGIHAIEPPLRLQYKGLGFFYTGTMRGYRKPWR